MVPDGFTAPPSRPTKVDFAGAVRPNDAVDLTTRNARSILSAAVTPPYRLVSAAVSTMKSPESNITDQLTVVDQLGHAGAFPRLAGLMTDVSAASPARPFGANRITTIKMTPVMAT